MAPSACRDCKNCTNSSIANAGRKFGRASMATMTLGMSEAAMATRKKCRLCGHQMSLHGTDQVGGAVQPTVQVQQQPQGYAGPAVPPPAPQPQPQAAPGWYYPEGPGTPPRWWDGYQWHEPSTTPPPPPA